MKTEVLASKHASLLWDYKNAIHTEATMSAKDKTSAEVIKQDRDAAYHVAACKGRLEGFMEAVLAILGDV